MPNDDRIYHSSCEKNIVRTHFDLPLLRSLRGRKESGLRYFGLPGRECLDIREWRELLTDVVAVDKFADNVRAMRTVLETEFANMRTKAHLGEVDSVIIENIGDANSVAENIARNWVGNEFEDSINSYVWRFDVVNLDYFGNLLPPSNHRNSDPARRRAAALTRLFEKERLDSWQSWVMLLTVGGGRYNAGTQRLLKSYLMDAKNEASADVGEALEFILKPTPDLRVNSAKLVHGTIANLLSGPANDANLEICPRGTIAYLGADNLGNYTACYNGAPGGYGRAAMETIYTATAAPNAGLAGGSFRTIHRAQIPMSRVALSSRAKNVMQPFPFTQRSPCGSLCGTIP